MTLRTSYASTLCSLANGTPESVADRLRLLLRPRLLVCIAGAYSDDTEHCLEVTTAVNVIRATRTNACTIHIPLETDKAPKQCLPIDDFIAAFARSSDVIPLLNTSRATNAKQAVQMVKYGLEIFEGLLGKLFKHSPLIKLEVLDRDLNAVDDDVLAAIEAFPPEIRRQTLPILTPAPRSVRRAVALGCPAVRLLTGTIGKATGILDPRAAVAAIHAANGLPVIFEGGLDTADHVAQSARLGASGALLNSTFRMAKNPIAHAAAVRAAADRSWP